MSEMSSIGKFRAIVEIAIEPGDPSWGELRRRSSTAGIRWDSEKLLPSHRDRSGRSVVEVTLSAETWDALEAEIGRLKQTGRVLKARAERERYPSPPLNLRQPVARRKSPNRR